MKRLLAAALLAAAPHVACGQLLDRPVVLVAAPDLQGLYARTAVLVVPVSNGQHLGFILNRATDVKLATLFPGLGPGRERARGAGDQARVFEALLAVIEGLSRDAPVPLK